MFKHLDYSRGWDDYWSDHPEGYSPQEQMINWTGQLNAMIDFFNKYFDVDLTEYATEVMEGWYVDGRLVDIINEALFNSKADKTTVNALIDIAANHASQLTQNMNKAFYDSMINSKAKKKLVAWIDDDGKSEFYDYFKGLYQDYGTVFNAAIVGSWIGRESRMSVAQMQELQELGFGFPSHGYSHDINNRLADMSEAALHADMRNARNAMKKNGLVSDVIVYGFGSHNKNSRNVVRQYFKAGITAPDGVGYFNPDPYDQFIMRRINAHYPNEEIFPIVEEAAALNEPLIFISHINTTGWPGDSKIRALIQKLLNEGYEFVSIDELVKQTGNVAQFGNIVFGASGKVSGLGAQVVDYNYYEYNAPLTDFPINQQTIFRVRRGDAPHYNLDDAGHIKVYRFSEDYYGVRKFVSSDRHGRPVLYSYWNETDEEWTEWFDTSNTLFAGISGYEPNAPITDFPLFKETIITVNNVTRTDYGLPAPGIIKTIRPSTDAYYGFQEFNSVRDESLRLTRTWDITENAWTEWK